MVSGSKSAIFHAMTEVLPNYSIVATPHIQIHILHYLKVRCTQVYATHADCLMLPTHCFKMQARGICNSVLGPKHKDTTRISQTLEIIAG